MDEKPLEERFAELRTLQVYTVRLLSLIRSDIEVNRALLMALQIRTGLPSDELTKKVCDEHRRALDRMNGAVERTLRALGVAEPPANDPWWDQPEEK